MFSPASTLRLWLGLTVSGTAVAAPPAAPLHPIPDFAPVKAVLISEDLLASNYHAPELINALADAGAQVWVATVEPREPRAFAAALKEQGVSARGAKETVPLTLPHGNIWLRDYAPVPLLDANGGLALASFRYEDPSTTANDLFAKLAAKNLALPLTEIPIVLDGGNFQTDGDSCFTSAADLPKTMDPNSGGPGTSRDLGRKTTASADALPRYGAKLGCRATYVLKDPPHAHLDMWFRLVAPKSVLVNQLDDRTMAAAKSYYGHIPPELTELRDALDKQARELSATLTVHRVPMPLPYRNVFRTFANAVLVNGHAILPSFQRFGWGYDQYPDAALEPYYEQKAAAAYRAAGYSSTFINADGLLYNGGAFHCVTSQIPDTRKSLPTKGH